jgi:hypothetical protein
MGTMKRALVACVVLLPGCNRPQPEADEGSRATPDAPAEPASPQAPAAAVPSKATAPASPSATPTPTEPTPPEDPVTPPPPDITALLDRLVPATERIAVTEEAARALEIRVIDNDLWVTDGSRRAPLRRRANAITRVTLGRTEGGEPMLLVDYEDDVSCLEQEQHVELPARSLLAKLENAAAMKPHGKHDFEASTRGFARAVELDPFLDVAWTNLACALAMHGDAAAAITVLDPMLRREPFQTYHKLLSDPELASLRERPELTALRAPKRGDASIRKLVIAHSAHHSLVALRRTEQSWGACNRVEDLRLFSTTTGEPVLTLPLVGWDETEPDCDEGGGDGGVIPRHRAKVNTRLDTAERFLRDLGFSVSAGLELVDPSKTTTEDGPHTAAKLPGASLELEIDDESIRVRKGGEVLVTQSQDVAQGITLAGHDPVARVAFIEWYHDVPEGCDDEEDGTGIIVVPLPKSP